MLEFELVFDWVGLNIAQGWSCRVELDHEIGLRRRLFGRLCDGLLKVLKKAYLPVYWQRGCSLERGFSCRTLSCS